MYAGPSEDALALFPTRVVPLPEGGSAEAVLADDNLGSADAGDVDVARPSFVGRPVLDARDLRDRGEALFGHSRHGLPCQVFVP